MTGNCHVRFLEGRAAARLPGYSISSHSLGILMVRDDIAIVCELFMADATFPVLLDNLSVQHLSHFGY
ncbi:MAG: hypothetical protein DMG82_11365 [Acidobacteria bacterium]|nr:MAG: hypothetical protein DMG82_11365 [Acidobacteriota bacterium]PYX39981.1 MAG: hypothetical protein DMG83_27485 [Acidobacteriota bacterium]